MTSTATCVLKQMAAGRLFAMLSRPFAPGDVEAYHQVRDVFMTDELPTVDHRPNYARDHAKGAQGD